MTSQTVANKDAVPQGTLTGKLTGPVDSTQDISLDFQSVNLPHLEPEILVSGNPEKGIVHFFRQRHSTSRQRGQELVHTGKCQEKLLRALIESDLKELFVEGYTYRLSPEEARESFSDLVEVLLPQGELPEELSDEQLQCLAYLGGPEVYSVLRSGVTIHPVCSPERNRELEDIINDPALAEEVRKNAIYQERERAAFDEMSSFQANNPEIREVALIYGALHKFNEETLLPEQLDNSPTIFSYLVKDDEMNSFDLGNRLSQTSDPDEQLEIISKLSEVPFWALSKSITVEALKAALPKGSGKFFFRRGDSFTIITPEGEKSLWDTEIEPLVSEAPELQVLLDKLYKEGKGPFSTFSCQVDLNKYEELIKESSTDRISVIVGVVAHEYTQYLMVKKSPALEEAVFEYLGSRPAQLVALDKLVPFSGSQDPEESLRSLLVYAVDDAVGRAIKKRYNKGQAPFQDCFIEQPLDKVPAGVLIKPLFWIRRGLTSLKR